ncbi:MAG: DUF4352 domain-containing protein [Candidatus Limnocylindrales bacterium]
MPSPRSRVALATVAMTLLIAACGGSIATTVPSAAGPTLSPTPEPTAAASLTPLVTAEVTVAPATAPPVTAPPVTAPPITEPPPIVPAIGVKLLIGDEQYMTVVDAELWAGTSQVKPRSGKVFYTVFIQIDAIKLTSFDSADFKLKDAAAKSYAWRPGRAPHLYSANNMTAGGTYSGWITYEIPKASLGNLTLIYKPAFLTGKTFTIPLF